MNPYISVILRQKKFFISLLFLFCFPILIFVLLQGKEATKVFSQPETILIVLSPHFDDAALSVGGILKQFQGEKYIITFFSTPTTTDRVLTDWDKISGFKTSADARIVRAEENSKVAKFLGAHDVTMQYADFQYNNRSGREKNITETRLVTDIENFVGAFSSSTIVVLGPSYFGHDVTHPDHELLSSAFETVAEHNISPRLSFFFYEDFPYITYRFPHNPSYVKFLLEERYKNVRLLPESFLFSESSLKAKIESINAYTSQVKAYKELGQDISSDDFQFTKNRCKSVTSLFRSDPCEVLYKIERRSP